MGRYTIVKQRYDIWMVMEGSKLLYKFATLDQAQRKIEMLEYVDFLRENLNPY